MAYAKDGIRINAICPGYVQTNFIQKALNAGLFDEEFKKIPMGRPAQIEEIVDSIVFLASPMSSYMTGATLVVDGYVFSKALLADLRLPACSCLPLVARYNELKQFLTGVIPPPEGQWICISNTRDNEADSRGCRAVSARQESRYHR